MPDSDTDSVVEAMEGSGKIDPTAIATIPKKESEEEEQIS